LKENRTNDDKTMDNEKRSAQKTKPEKADRLSRLVYCVFPIIFAAVLGLFCIVYHIIPGPEFVFLILLIYAAYSNKTWKFLKDWLPFLLVFASYEAMNSIVGAISNRNLSGGPYNLDLKFFGGFVPTLILQQNIRLPILDWVGAFFYAAYFFLPTIFGYIVWRKDGKAYWKYTVALGILTYSALVTFLVYPVAPPWLNSTLTAQGVTRVLITSVDKYIGAPVYKMAYDFLGPNLYAAFPSMHSALPWLVFLFAFKVWGKKALPVLAFPVGIWFSAIYLGEHYVADVLGGIAYATVAFLVVEKLWPALSSKIHFSRSRGHKSLEINDHCTNRKSNNG
jgi:membrane-associated phospholipid phosphatase